MVKNETPSGLSPEAICMDIKSQGLNIDGGYCSRSNKGLYNDGYNGENLESSKEKERESSSGNSDLKDDNARLQYDTSKDGHENR